MMLTVVNLLIESKGLGRIDDRPFSVVIYKCCHGGVNFVDFNRIC